MDITNAILYLFERTVENAMVQIAWRRENDLVLLNIPLFSLFSLIFGDNYSFNGIIIEKRTFYIVLKERNIALKNKHSINNK